MKLELELRKDKPEMKRECLILCDDGCENSPYLCEDFARETQGNEEGWEWNGTYHANVLGWMYSTDISV